MPLPQNGVPWPPKALTAVLPRLAEWSAWYSGSPEELRAAYSTRSAPVIDRPSQYRGGVTGAAARAWWGRPIGDLTKRHDQLHVPIAADLCQASADLLFAEPPTITVENSATQDRIGELVDDGLHSILAGSHEVAAALGGVFLRVNWDQDVVPDRPFLSALHPDHAVPEYRWGRLVAVTFWWVVRQTDSTVIRHLERHELDSSGYGIVVHGLYEGTADNLGRAIPLNEHPSTEGLALVVDADSAISTESPGLAVNYVPNQTPQRRWRNDPVGANYGRSDLDGVESFMDALDETYSSLMRDIRLGKARVLVAQSMLDNLGPGRGAAFDMDQDVFSPVNALPPRESGGGLPIEQVQFAIRVEEHLRSTQELTEVILRSAGYSAQTFGEGPEGAVTATEVQSRERRSYLTRDRKIRNWRPGVGTAITKLLAVDQAIFRTPNNTDGLKVIFGDSVQDSPEALARTAQTLLTARAASTRVRVQLVHPDWEDRQVDEEVRTILAEDGMAVPDPIGQGENLPDLPQPPVA